VQEFDYQLKKPFEYSKDGQFYPAAFLRLTAPTSKNATEGAILKQAFMRASLAATYGRGNDDAPDKPAKQPTGREIIAVLAMSQAVELAEVLKAAQRLFTSGVAMVDGETKLTLPLYEKMALADVEEALGDYLVNFIISSELELSQTS
jgi:hypothetical protein